MSSIRMALYAWFAWFMWLNGRSALEAGPAMKSAGFHVR
jgi:hypothetical protein